MPDAIAREALETYTRFVAMRDEIDEGRRGWADLADFFTLDAAYIDPAWGRIEGREKIREFFVKSMAGLTGHGWSTPENWTMAEGHRLVSQWDQILGHKPDGTPWLVPGLSILYYAGDGLFCYSHDMLNMTHIGQTMRAMGWKRRAVQSASARAESRRLASRRLGAPRAPIRRLIRRAGGRPRHDQQGPRRDRADACAGPRPRDRGGAAPVPRRWGQEFACDDAMAFGSWFEEFCNAGSSR